jgi:hypothetical protein
MDTRCGTVKIIFLFYYGAKDKTISCYLDPGIEKTMKIARFFIKLLQLN